MIPILAKSYTRGVKSTLVCALLLFAMPAAVFGADGKAMFNGKNLDGWEIIGDGQWTVMADGTLLGQRIPDLRKLLVPGGAFGTPYDFKSWVDTQSWLYTRRNDFGEFDLHVEYWTKTTGNSGVSIRDTSRAKWAITTPPDYTRTPSKIGYEIQINNRFPDPHPSGSIYGFMDAPKDVQHDDDWNAMDISLRNDKITIRLNGRVVAEHGGDRSAPRPGPSDFRCTISFPSSCSATCGFKIGALTSRFRKPTLRGQLGRVVPKNPIEQCRNLI